MKTICLWKLPLVVIVACYTGLIVLLISDMNAFTALVQHLSVAAVWLSPLFVAELTFLVMILFQYQYLQKEQKENVKFAFFYTSIGAIIIVATIPVIETNFKGILIGSLISIGLVGTLLLLRWLGKVIFMPVKWWLFITNHNEEKIMTVLGIQLLFTASAATYFVAFQQAHLALFFGAIAITTVLLLGIIFLCFFVELIFPGSDYTR